MVEVIIGATGAILTACGIINDLRKAFKDDHLKEKMQKLFKEVENTQPMVSLLRDRIKTFQKEDAEVLVNPLNDLENHMNQTKEFLQMTVDNPPSVIRRWKRKRLKKDADCKRSLLEMSKSSVEGCMRVLSIPVAKTNKLRGQHLINPDQLMDIKDFCDGTWGPVKKATYNGCEVVVKYINVENNAVIEYFEKEAEKLVQFWYGYVVRLIGICDQKDVKFLVLEYVHRKGLDNVLYNCPDELQPQTRVSMALDAAKAVRQVNGLNLLHVGLAAKTFLVDKDYNVKISDLRFAKGLSSRRRYERTWNATDNINYYTCPEWFDAPSEFTDKSQVYSFGIVLWEILSRSKPFSTLERELGRPPLNEVEEFVKANRVETLNQDFGKQSWNSGLNALVQNCRNVKPDKRPTVQDIIDTLEKILDEMEIEDKGADGSNAEGANVLPQTGSHVV